MKSWPIIVLLVLLCSCSGSAEDKMADESDQDTLIVDSLELYSGMVKQYPNSSESYYQRAAYLIRQGDIQSAQADLESAIAIDSSVNKVRTLYADVMVAQLDLETGKYNYEYVLSNDSSNVKALMGLAKIYALLENNAQAVYYLGTLLEYNPYYADAYFMKGMIYQSDYYKTGRQESWDRAVSSYQTAVEQDPNYYSAYVALGVMHDQVNSDLALEYYNAALEVYPESIEAWYNIGWFYQKRGDIDNAQATYRRLNQIDSTYAEGYYNQGYIQLINIGNVDSAIFFFDKAVYFDPEYYKAYNNLGLCYEKKKDYNEARKYYQKAIEIYPDFQLAKDNLNALQ